MRLGKCEKCKTLVEGENHEVWELLEEDRVIGDDDY